MKKIESITIKRIPDYDSDLSYLGQFSSEKGKFAIETNGGSRNYEYFNAENVENMKQAQENFNRIMNYEKGNLIDYGIKAEAEIRTSYNGKDWLINEVRSGGLWGISSDSDESYFTEIESEQLEELKDLLLEFGFTKKEINKVKIDKDNN